MKDARITAIRTRLESVVDFNPRVQRYGTPVVLITCATEREAETPQALLLHVRADLQTLLDEIKEMPE